jgi:hypothetical protein
MRRLVLLVTVVAACTPEIPEGRAACADARDCPTGWACRSDQRCWRTPGDVDGGQSDDAGSDVGLDSSFDGGVDARSSEDTGAIDTMFDTGRGCPAIDADGDGYFAPCAAADASVGDDCDDADGAVHPTATETRSTTRIRISPAHGPTATAPAAMRRARSPQETRIHVC